MTVLKSGSFSLVKSRLPLIDIAKRFQVKDLVWVDADLPLTANDEGLSEMSFASMGRVNLTGTAL
ncbi:hypothetical protein DFA_09327 [Cavenderia fasciculata]|uniref:Uncharacterized protein n=1 Tax=Cavenderia fasciculata TaxID=261658 RepID=F4Q7B5_CACFS|nr:uncharacterized protein DFA_09327 [Cavenderia fasciculata]EGG16297.1 hypothetical protein DFA_09327 [Cavenderia fasciculata]|eukprot:XP_004354681.1 hypothetical protein DFA_09327 [Cavenderia fasciculata]